MAKSCWLPCKPPAVSQGCVHVTFPLLRIFPKFHATQLPGPQFSRQRVLKRHLGLQAIQATDGHIPSSLLPQSGQVLTVQARRLQTERRIVRSADQSQYPPPPDQADDSRDVKKQTSLWKRGLPARNAEKDSSLPRVTGLAAVPTCGQFESFVHNSDALPLAVTTWCKSEKLFTGC